MSASVSVRQRVGAGSVGGRSLQLGGNQTTRLDLLPPEDATANKSTSQLVRWPPMMDHETACRKAGRRILLHVPPLDVTIASLLQKVAGTLYGFNSNP